MLFGIPAGLNTLAAYLLNLNPRKMNKFYTLAVTVFFSGVFSANAQWLEGEEPISFQANMHVNHTDVITFPAPDLAAIFDEDLVLFEETGREYMGRMLACDYTMDEIGTWHTLPDGSQFWTAKLSSTGAQGLAVLFEELHIPCGGRLWAMTGDRVYYDAPYTCEDINKYRTLITGDIFGDEVILEYHQPKHIKGTPSFRIKGLDYFYRHIYDIRDEMERGSDPCQIDVNCPEGDNWQPQRDSVVRLLIQDGGGSFLCTGVMVNTTARDCRLYMLTAHHCVEGITDFSGMQVRFNYERSGCGTGVGPSNRNKTGTTKLADCACGGGNNGSDFALFELNNTIDFEAWPVYFAGWDANNVAATSGTSIHHPSGDRKKISTFTQPLISATWFQASNAHWRVIWAATVTNHGVTEEGSSGSPIFNQNKRIVGNLTGGSSFCTALFAPDLYGKFSYHWLNNPNSSTQKLKEWLDPIDTGENTMEGSYTPCTSGLAITENSGLEMAATLYPNPSSDVVNITFHGNSFVGTATVFDATGRIAKIETINGANAVLAVSDLNAGVYSIVVAGNDDFSNTLRFVKQ